jgi:hypothetical protein
VKLVIRKDKKGKKAREEKESKLTVKRAILKALSKTKKGLTMTEIVAFVDDATGSQTTQYDPINAMVSSGDICIADPDERPRRYVLAKFASGKQRRMSNEANRIRLAQKAKKKPKKKPKKEKAKPKKKAGKKPKKERKVIKKVVRR